ncbi:hypothetical protein [Marinirhabdus gelatinilytica]|uniref:Uncharacterized protein n=1 Tax=Marinirhabdus gelatinilytica TaxID=1703343 RepID=A0A370QLP9_9FLAO|nr:hypothetical protein [Marinirhabdus gelatinilytica]RDK89261.1 hypothetical protein C8D94_1011147 [Marinirhabdus gelatinilytica]
MNKKKFVLCFVLLFSVITAVPQQSMSEYSFIEVPENFDFLDEKDKYQLNSLTKFLFNKHGFNAYFPNELPNVKRCDGLYASVESKLGFIYTRTVVIVKDCNGFELFRSEEGKSKLKEYRKTYQESLRNAFLSFEGLGVSQKDPGTKAETSENNNNALNNGNVEAAAKNKTETIAVVETSVHNFPTARFSTYKVEKESYLLRKTKEGYTLFKENMASEGDLEEMGTLMLIGDTLQFKTTEGVQHNASFDAEKNLTIILPSGKQHYKLVQN